MLHAKSAKGILVIVTRNRLQQAAKWLSLIVVTVVVTVPLTVLGVPSAALFAALVVGITVNAIPPGFIDTPMLRAAEERGDTNFEKALAMTPVRRAGQPEDIAAACAFLVSEEAGYITGQILGVNGGRNT